MSFHSTLPTVTLSALELGALVLIAVLLTWLVARGLAESGNSRTVDDVHRELDRLAEAAPQVSAAADLHDEDVDAGEVVANARDAGKVDALLWFLGERRTP